MIKLRLGKSTKTGIGGKRTKGVHESLERKPVKRKNGAIRFRSRTSKRGREAELLPMVRQLLVREYEMLWGDRCCDGMELDHIIGRHGGDFALGAMLDPQNMQMLTPKEHRFKTDGDKIDYRNTETKARLIKLSNKIIEKMPKVWNLKDLRCVLLDMVPDEPF